MKKKLLLMLLAVCLCAAKKPQEKNAFVLPSIEVVNEEEPSDAQNETEPEKSDRLVVLYGGDIMASTINYTISDFKQIWSQVKDEIRSADLAVGNLEAAICPEQEWSGYPRFNMHPDYARAAVDAGFDLFSLANNHSFDQFSKGVRETLKFTRTLTEEAQKEGHHLHFSGVRESKDSPYKAVYFERKGWRILFLAVTEFVNIIDKEGLVHVIPPQAEARAKFIEQLKQLKDSHPSDLFILSIHTSDVEYTRETIDAQLQYYEDLLDAGIDVILANHAHLIKDRRIRVNQATNRDQLLMMANGNTISGQRFKPTFGAKLPDSKEDNVGDGLLYEVHYVKDDAGSLKIEYVNPRYITTYINPNTHRVLRWMNDQTIEALMNEGRKAWSNYIRKRLKVLHSQTHDLIEWK